MKPMKLSTKNTSFIMALTALVIFSVSCQKNEDRQAVQIVRGPVDGRNIQVASDIPLAGIIYTSPQYAREFTDSVKGLMSASLPENAVCDVNPSNGVQVGGIVSFTGGSPQQAATSGQQFQVAPGSRLRIRVRDSCVGQSDQSGQPIPALPEIAMPQAQGYISGNYLSIQFYDQYGTIQIEGSFDSKEISARVRYNNRVSYPNGPGQNGTLGDFRVPTCQFFRC